MSAILYCYTQCPIVVQEEYWYKSGEKYEYFVPEQLLLIKFCLNQNKFSGNIFV